MAIRDEVLHVARLARLALSDEEIDRLGAQLNAILEAVGKVSELDLADVEPTAHPLDLVNVWAEDEPQDSLPVEEALANAPDREAGFFRVPPHERPRQRHTAWPCPCHPRVRLSSVGSSWGGRSGVPDLEAVPRDRHAAPDREAGQRPARDGRGVVGRDLLRLPRRDRRARRGAQLLPPRERRRARRGHPDRAQGRRQHEGHPDDGRLEDPRGLRPGLRRDRRRALQGAAACA